MFARHTDELRPCVLASAVWAFAHSLPSTHAFAWWCACGRHHLHCIFCVLWQRSGLLLGTAPRGVCESHRCMHTIGGHRMLYQQHGVSRACRIGAWGYQQVSSVMTGEDFFVNSRGLSCGVLQNVHICVLADYGKPVHARLNSSAAQ